MKLEIHVHHHHHNMEYQAVIEALENLRAKVEENTSVDQSAVTLLEGLTARLNEMANSATDLEELRAGVQELTASLGQDNATLAAAVSANTPAAPGGDTPADPTGDTP